MQRPWLLGGVLLVVMALVFALGMTFGYGVGRSVAQAATPSVPIDEHSDESAFAALNGDFGLFWEAMELIYHDFDGRLPTPKEATYGAIRGVVELLDDPHTSFLSPDEAKFFRSNVEGAFEGIGARVAWDEKVDTLLITDSFENQPAWQAGLRRLDLVLAVNGKSLVGTSVDEAVRLIRGPKGTQIMLTVQRGDAPPFTVTVMRNTIAIPIIATDSLGNDGKIAYVKLNTFSDDAGTLLREAVKNALQREPRAMILDLRGNSGGLLREAVKVANVFMQDETVLLERFADGRTESYATTDKAVTTDLPLVVLVNEGSASASEIVAGALQDVNRATLIGTVTYGKGSVQMPNNLSDGSILRVTIARWYTPKDRTINGVGLTPDIDVTVSDAELEAGSDPQLDAAVHFLTSSEVPAGAIQADLPVN
jgi:carboxyl-terminal processing protease